MRIFVAGATGVIGRRVVPLLVHAGHEVTGVGRSDGKRGQLQRAGARAVDVNLFDAEDVTRAIAGHDIVLNLATAVPKPWRMFLPGGWRQMDRVRREVSATLADAAIASGSVGRVIQESFAPIYEDAGDAWIDERSPVHAARYNRSVLDAEANAMRVGEAGRASVVLRFGALYGAGDPFAVQMIDMVKRGWFPLFGRPEGYFSFLDVGDAAAAVVASLSVPPGIYNVVEHEPMRRRDLAVGLAQLLGVKPPRHFAGWAARMAGSLGETLSRSLRISNRKLERAGEWTPQYRSALDGFRAIVSGTPASVKAVH